MDNCLTTSRRSPYPRRGCCRRHSPAPACCAIRIRIHLLVDGVEVAVTGFVGASGNTGTFNLGPVTSGSHVLGLQAEGQVGGCNSGTLASWAGTLSVTTAAATLSEWALFVLLGLVAAFGVRRLRVNS